MRLINVLRVSVGHRSSTPIPSNPPFPNFMEATREREISGLTIRIDRDLCIGSGNCVNLAPEIFEIDEENIVDFLDDTPDIDQGRLTEACSLCPVDALIVENADGEQIVP